MTTSKSRSFLLVACFLLCSLGASAGTPDSDRFWTTVGSAGTLDEKSEGKVFFDRAVVQKGQTIGFKSARVVSQGEGGVSETDSAVIRYNVTAVDGLFDVQGIRMAVRFLDEGVDARVFAQLIEVDMLTGAEVTLMTFDSDDPNVPVLSGYHMYDVCDDNRKQQFDFVQKAYYVEATLTTSAFVTPSAAGIEAIQLNATPCP